ncbi:SRPBCC family protein [Marinigracilibium pacificum]|uniref:SRPBCC family protein n=1 Tax=Marinigracilibium pacificum TaxID=2729599 RepID=A0A848IXP1_9BACT|nr:SRPBCC family protein [Marinigracilibium pacificum]NMM47938.1 SRPBCC family protein [Marinigracilibium pacificum]
MKYRVERTINKPIDEVVSKFNNADNLKKWMDGLQTYEHISGTPGETGAKAKMSFKMKNREMEMIETIIKNDLPSVFSASYEANGVMNINHNGFKKIDDNTTLYFSEQEFQLKGFMKLMGWFMPGAFKKQTAVYMDSFKNFVESTDPVI